MTNNTFFIPIKASITEKDLKDVDYVNNASTDLLQLSQVIVRIILKPTISIILNSKRRS
jgi:hypothetical protein